MTESGPLKETRILQVMMQGGFNMSELFISRIKEVSKGRVKVGRIANGLPIMLYVMPGDWKGYIAVTGQPCIRWEETELQNFDAITFPEVTDGVHMSEMMRDVIKTAASDLQEAFAATEVDDQLIAHFENTDANITTE